MADDTTVVHERDTGAEIRRYPGEALRVVGDVVVVAVRFDGELLLRAMDGDAERWRENLGPAGSMSVRLMGSDFGDIATTPASDLFGLMLDGSPVSSDSRSQEGMGLRISDGAVLAQRQRRPIVPLQDSFLLLRGPDEEAGETWNNEVLSTDGARAQIGPALALQTRSASGTLWNLIHGPESFVIADRSWRPASEPLPDGALPLACGDRLIAVPNQMFALASETFAAYAANGDQLWTRSLPHVVGAVCTPSSVIAIGTTGQVSGLSLRTGEIKWQGTVQMPSTLTDLAFVRATPHGLLLVAGDVTILLR